MRKKINFEEDFIERKLKRQQKNDQKKKKRFASLRKTLYNEDYEFDDYLDDDHTNT